MAKEWMKLADAGNHYALTFNDKTPGARLPLDSRKTYTKSAWIIRTATLTSDKKQFEERSGV